MTDTPVEYGGLMQLMGGEEQLPAAMGGLNECLKDQAYLLPIDASADMWAAHWVALSAIEQRIPWWVGDCLLAGETRFPDRYSQVCEVTGLQSRTLWNTAWVCRAFPPHQRRPELSFTHHREVAGIEDMEKREYWLDQAVENGWSVGELTAARRGLHGNVGSRIDPLSEDLPDAMGEAIRAACTQLMKVFAEPPTEAHEIDLKTAWGTIRINLLPD